MCDAALVSVRGMRVVFLSRDDIGYVSTWVMSLCPLSLYEMERCLPY